MRHLRVLAALLAAAALLAGCSVQAPRSAVEPAGSSEPSAVVSPAAAAVFPVTVKDDLDRSVTIEKRPERFVSLAPADTEILFSLGLGSKVVGVTTYDDFPAEVKTIEKMGDFTQPNLEKIAAAKPDVVFVTGGIQMDVVKKLEGLGAKVVAIDPPSVARLYTSIETVGKVTGTPAKAAEVVARIEGDVKKVTDAVGKGPLVTTFVEVAQNPLYTAGTDTLLNDLIALAGGDNVVKEPGYVGYSLERLLKDDPQVYLVTKGSMSDPSGIEKRPGYDKLKAVKTKRVYVLDDNLVSRPGPRIVLGLEQIADALSADR